jgi:rod shape determining protein RodA
MFDRRLIKHFDWGLAACAVLLAGLSVYAIYSATFASLEGWKRGLYLRQATWAGLGLGAMLVVCCVHYRNFARFAYVIYALTGLALLIVAVAGKESLGAQRWLRLGPLTLQPSEVAKLALILFLARYFDDRKDELSPRPAWAVPGLLAAAPALLVLKQPDLGTALLLLLLAGALFHLAGLRARSLAAAAAVGLAAAPVLWQVLKEYQRQRIRVFFDPSLDPLGVGYHIAQSKIAIGSGGLLGKGFLGATQSQLHFLPENHTDFIFAVLAEQWGFVGSLVLVALYAGLFARALRVVREARDFLAMVLAYGVFSMLALQVVVNLGMVLGILPVVGLPLPLVSYGGSSMVVTLVAVGVLLNIRMRRFMY